MNQNRAVYYFIFFKNKRVSLSAFFDLLAFKQKPLSINHFYGQFFFCGFSIALGRELRPRIYLNPTFPFQGRSELGNRFFKKVKKTRSCFQTGPFYPDRI